MLKAFKYRLYPTKAQAGKINQNIGCARLVYNLMLDAKTKHYEATKKTLHITPASFKTDKTFLRDVDSLALANAQLNLEQAYRNFFKNPEHFGFPQFKSKKHSRLSYKTNNQKTKSKDAKCTIFFDGNRLKLPKVGYVKIIEHRQHEGEIKSVVVSHERSGEYYASVLCEVKQTTELPKTDKHIGIDLGLHNFIVCSDGQRVQTPKFFRKAEQKLAKRLRAFAKTVKDSKNHEKLRIKVAKCHQKIKNQRKDFLQKLSTKLIRENQVISLEDLSVKGMEANHCIAKSVADASFSMFVNMLEYKAEWYGRTIVKIDRFYPSTQLCSGCGFQNKSIRGIKSLKVREWVCPCCGEVHDRDLNASRNIDREGLTILNRRNDGVSSLTECHTDELVLSSDILAREATQSSDAWWFTKNKYKNFVYGLYPQIAQNWCLCMYCKLHRPELITTYLHWRSELETHIGRLNSKSIDKPRDRKKWTHEAMITEADMDKPDVVFGECRIKFRHENDNGLNMSMPHQHEVCELFSNNVMDVIECIGSTSDITEYTRKIK